MNWQEFDYFICFDLSALNRIGTQIESSIWGGMVKDGRQNLQVWNEVVWRDDCNPNRHLDRYNQALIKKKCPSRSKASEKSSLFRRLGQPHKTLPSFKFDLNKTKNRLINLSNQCTIWPSEKENFSNKVIKSNQVTLVLIVLSTLFWVRKRRSHDQWKRSHLFLSTVFSPLLLFTL